MSNQSEYAYHIEGGQPIVGEIKCLGDKNFVTKAMVAALLGDTPTVLTNVPPIGDVDITIEMLTSIGVNVQRTAGNTLTIDPSTMNLSRVPTPHSGSNRIPILLLGALLHRFEKVSVPVVGGCKIGTRSVDYHLGAIEQFGGRVEDTDGGYIAYRERPLKGTHIKLPYPSVSGRDIRIEGVKQLNGTSMQVLGDRIEAASWACLACASDGDITVHGIRPDTLGNFLAYYQQVGGGVELAGPNSIRFFRKDALRPTIIETDVYPGFSTDWQQPFAILLTQANGISIIHETVYESRFGYLKALDKLGARTQLTTDCLGGTTCRYREMSHEHSAIILGPTPLRATDQQITIPDLRAGLAYVIAAAISEGTSIVTGIHYLERGYGNIVPRLAAMNLKIERVNVS